VLLTFVQILESDEKPSAQIRALFARASFSIPPPESSLSSSGQFMQLIYLDLRNFDALTLGLGFGGSLGQHERLLLGHARFLGEQFGGLLGALHSVLNGAQLVA
jgi:hypothetical protein